MFQRRLDLILLKQHSTEQNIRRLVDAADQCDLERMTRQEFLIMCVITNTIDDKLRSELRKMMEPDWTEVRAKCEKFDRAQSCVVGVGAGDDSFQGRSVAFGGAADLSEAGDGGLRVEVGLFFCWEDGISAEGVGNGVLLAWYPGDKEVVRDKLLAYAYES